jgi:hypothetical protein
MGILAVPRIFGYNVIWDRVQLFEELTEQNSGDILGRLIDI